MPAGSEVEEEVEEEDEFNVDYSFAMEYKGPLVGYEIPQVVPVDVKRIPVADAAVVNDEYLLRDYSVPVAQPVLKRVNGGRMCLAGSDFLAAKLVEIERYGSGIGKENEDEEDFGWDGDLVHRNRSSGLRVVQGFKNGEGEVDAVKSFGRTGNVDSMGLSEDTLGSCGLAGVSDTVEVELPCKSEIDKNHDDCVGKSISSSGEESLSRSISLETYSCAEEEQDHDDEEPIDVRKPYVKFQEGEPIGIDYVDFDSESEDDESLEVQQVPAAERRGKKGSCYRCFKGNRWMKKEDCFVCGAKFCSKCLLKMMGDMSEGRKCITCIGFPINESRRGSLGKPSRLLKQLLSEFQLKQVMNQELTSGANQLLPELIVVNQKPLSDEEMSVLQNCKWPPKGLKPGEYWYDKVSGLWGKVS